MNRNILNKIEKLKAKYKPEGFIILGVFGSYARGEENDESDIDILYELTEEFYQKYPGWNAVSVIEDIRQEFKESLGKKIDFADKNALRIVGKKYILPEVAYV
ncbi:MAG: nucleotidyltransferase domain-containing protein [Spirochaetes bacterium]|nr:nucleotidyltransferase domain-containing protein [Spirochaetota bacterium]